MKRAAPRLALRLPALVLLIGLAAWYAGRAVAAVAWRGEYIPRLNMIDDLGLGGCAPVEDFFAPRVACSPQQLWFVVGGAALAVSLISAGSLVARQRAQWHGAAAVGAAIALSGLLRTVALPVDAAQHPGLHYGLLAGALACLWAAMALAAVTARRRWVLIRPEGAPEALMGGPLAAATWPLLALSALGAALVVAAAFGTGYDNPVGYYQRMACDAPALWLLALAAGWWRK
ncbi:hypothetical protein V5S96_04115 [Corynebacterium mastitidis]|uniref:DUF998 domain-containing protein n=1 Tax=Corynebacterium mastitidis TaxID=161890 RepID=A0ABU8NXE7_9CORY